MNFHELRVVSNAFENWSKQHARSRTDAIDERIAWAAGARWAIKECLDEAAQHHDVVDGEDGTPRPNMAMSITTGIELRFGLVP